MKVWGLNATDLLNYVSEGELSVYDSGDPQARLRLVEENGSLYLRGLSPMYYPAHYTISHTLCVFRLSELEVFAETHGLPSFNHSRFGNKLPLEQRNEPKQIGPGGAQRNGAMETERNRTAVIEAIKKKLLDLNVEIERDYHSDFNAHWDEWDQVAAAASRETVSSHINSFLEMVAEYVDRKARSMQIKAFELFSDINADENVRNGVKEFILIFFDYSDDSFYIKDCQMFIGAAEKYDQERIAMCQSRLRHRVVNALRDACRTIEANFTLFGEGVDRGHGTPDFYAWLFSEPMREPKGPETVDSVARERQEPEPKQIGQGGAAAETTRKAEPTGEAERSSTVENNRPDGQAEKRFTHNEDYSYVESRDGIPFDLTPTQAAVIKVLHEASEKKPPYLREQTILAGAAHVLDKIDHGRRLKDVFSRKRAAFDALVERVCQGVYQLKT